MFGKPDWFREKRFGWGLTPVTWRGWVYTAVWTIVLIAPFVVLLLRGQLAESLIWLAAAMGLLLWDVWQILRAGRAKPRQEADDVLYIGDDDADSESVSTRHYDLRLRQHPR